MSEINISYFKSIIDQDRAALYAILIMKYYV